MIGEKRVHDGYTALLADSSKTPFHLKYQLAGAPGFEPGDGGIKIRCLTTWLRPNTPVPVAANAGGPYRGSSARSTPQRVPLTPRRAGKNRRQPGTDDRGRILFLDSLARGFPHAAAQVRVGKP